MALSVDAASNIDAGSPAPASHASAARVVASGFLLVYIAAQVLQRLVVWLSPPMPDDPVAAAAWLLTPGQITRRAAILLSMFGIAVSFMLVCRQRARTHSSLATTGLVFLLMFCFFEMSYRSVELFTVHLNWGREVVESADADRRLHLLARIDAFADIVEGAYFPLLLTQLAGSVCLLLTVRRRHRADRYLGASMAVNALRLGGRIAGGYLNVPGLAAFNGPLYFPLIMLMLILLLMYCQRADW